MSCSVGEKTIYQSSVSMTWAPGEVTDVTKETRALAGETGELLVQIVTGANLALAVSIWENS